MKGLLGQALDLFLPKSCAICGGSLGDSENLSYFENIYKSIYHKDSVDHICNRCMSSIVPAPSDKRWFLCMSEPFDGDPYPRLTLFVSFQYDGIIKRAIRRIKFDGKRDVARYFGILLGRILMEENVKADMVIPVPLHTERYEERGFNQAEEIGCSIAKMMGLPIVSNVLERSRYTMRQTDCEDNVSRISNVMDAFVLNPEWDITGLTIVLVDDVATTGMTLHEAARVLLDNGANKVLCVAFASNRQVKNAESF